MLNRMVLGCGNGSGSPKWQLKPCVWMKLPRAKYSGKKEHWAENKGLGDQDINSKWRKYFLMLRNREVGVKLGNNVIEVLAEE